MDSSTPGTYLGIDGIRNYSSNNAYVNIQNGILTAKNADITGKITAKEGQIGKVAQLKISDNGINTQYNVKDFLPKDHFVKKYPTAKDWYDAENGSGSYDKLDSVGKQLADAFWATATSVALLFAAYNYGPVISIKEENIGLQTSLNSSGILMSQGTAIKTLLTYDRLCYLENDDSTNLITWNQNSVGIASNNFINQSKYTNGNFYGLNELEGISGGKDFNNYTTPGVYAVKTYNADIANKPTKAAGRLVVYSATGSSLTSSYSYLMQEFHSNQPNDPVYKRLGTTGGTAGNWSFGAWYEQGQNIIKNDVVTLWSGLSQITNNDSLTLSDAISNQSHGIILRFVAYNKDTGESRKYHYNEYFVSKDFVSKHNGEGHTFAIWGNYFNAAATKYIYIYDTYVTGNANNILSGTAATGIVYDNSQYVLCEIIGV